MKLPTKLILALDVDNIRRAKYFVNELYPKIKIFKVGLQLFTAVGPEIVEFINKKGAGAFLDLKLFDIPNTVSNAVTQAVRLKVKMLTLHILGGREMIVRAQEAAKEESSKLGIKPPLLIGVTILTSQKARFQKVLKLAELGINSGLDGVVCSAWEARLLRKRIKKEFLIVTPGIRPDKANFNDQRRVATISEAVRAGSDFLVIGRPILEAKEPLIAAGKILNEINA